MTVGFYKDIVSLEHLCGMGAVCVSLLTLGVSLGEGVTGCLTDSCSDDSDLQGLA